MQGLTELRSVSRPWARPLIALAAVVSMPLAPGPRANLAAQMGPLTIDSDTRVGSIDFRFPNGSTLGENTLREHIALREPGGIAASLSFLPFVSAPERPRFRPISLQEDVARLRRLYRRQGFLATDIRYEVTHNEEKNLADIVFIIDEGRPIELSDIRFRSGEGDVSTALAPDLTEGWRRFQRDVQPPTGARVGESDLLRLERRVTEWLRDRGYANGSANASARVDSSTAAAEVTVEVSPGSRVRIDEVRIEGNQALSDGVIRRELPFESGDWFSAAKLTAARQRIAGIGLVQFVQVEPVGGVSADSTIDIRVRVEEGPPRQISGELGFATGSGLVLQTQWRHRNFLGGARRLTVTGLAESGLLALETNDEKLFRGGVTLEQPHVFHRRLTGLVTPSVEYRDDFRDRSWAFGLENSLIYQFGPLNLASVTYQLSRRSIQEYRLGEITTGDINLLELLTRSAQGALDSLGANIDQSSVRLAATLGELDDPAAPRRGVVVKPALELAVPSALTDIEYWRLDVFGVAYKPVSSRVGLALRVKAGRLFPFGKSSPETPEDAFAEALRLRDVAFTAGGTYDVRGWGNRLLGPKFPDAEFSSQGDSIVAIADRYVPLGGQARLVGSAELRLPFPGLGSRWGTQIFFDAGRVWTPDESFRLVGGPLSQDRFFFSTGAGVEFRAVFGAIRLDVGYKLNPSIFDLADPNEALQAIINDEPLSQLDQDSLRRLHIHLSLGSGF